MAAMIAASGSALDPSICPTTMPIADAVACCRKPSSDEAAPARSGNGMSAPAIDCGMARPRPQR